MLKDMGVKEATSQHFRFSIPIWLVPQGGEWDVCLFSGNQEASSLPNPSLQLFPALKGFLPPPSFLLLIGWELSSHHILHPINMELKNKTISRLCSSASI
jgi:hypothetical protein